MATSADTPQGSPVTGGESWQDNKSVIECNRHMLESGLGADVPFLVSSNTDGAGEVCTFHAHKYVLISRSPVFYSMLCGDLAENGEITVPDVEPDTFRQMLSYIYTDEVDLSPDMVMFVLYAAKKYLLHGLSTECTDFLRQHLNATTACNIYDQRILLQETYLEERCINLIKDSTKKAFEAETTTDISQNTLSKILDSDQFTIQEVDVFKFSLKWAQVKCKEQDKEATGGNMREVLGDCVYKIRFPTFQSSEIAEIVGPSGILTREEVLRMLRHLADKVSIPAPTGWICKDRFLPLQTYISKDMLLVSVNNPVFNMTIISNQDINVKSLVVGTCYDHYECELPLSSATHNDTAVILIATAVSLNDTAVNSYEITNIEMISEEWKVSSNLIIKAGESSTLQLEWIGRGPTSEDIDVSIYANNERQLRMKDEHVEITLASDNGLIPLLALKYELA